VDLVRALFDQHDDDLLFFAGCSDEPSMYSMTMKYVCRFSSSSVSRCS